MPVQRIALLALLACGIGQSGCAVVLPPPPDDLGPAAWYGGGRAVQEFALPGNDVGAALAAAMDDLKMGSVQRKRNGKIIELDAKTADNRSVLVTVRPHEGQTRVSCRIGWFGDEPLSMALLERTGVRLGTLPPAAIPDNPPSTPAITKFPRPSPPDEATLRAIAEAPLHDRMLP
jgi:hypothetical protein